jgi:hypothetical protein
MIAVRRAPNRSCENRVSLRNLFYTDGHHLPIRTGGGGGGALCSINVSAGHGDVKGIRGQWFVVVPVQVKISSMTVGAIATKIRADRLVQCLSVFPCAPRADFIKSLPYRLDDSILGI